MRAVTAEEIRKIAGGRNANPAGALKPMLKKLPPGSEGNPVPLPGNPVYPSQPSYPFDSGPYSNPFPSGPGSVPVPPPDGGGGGGGGGPTHAPDWHDVLNQAADILTSLGFYLPSGWTIGYGQYFEFKNTETGQMRVSQTYDPGQHEEEQDGVTNDKTHQVIVNDDSLSPYSADQSPSGDTFTIYVDSDGNPSTNGMQQRTITVPQLSQLEAAIVTLAHEYYHAAVDSEQGTPNPAWTSVEEGRAQTQAYIALQAYEKANHLSH